MTVKSRERAKIHLIIASILFPLLCVPAFMLILFSAMIYDSPQAAESVITNLMVGSLISFPFLVVLGIALGWILYAKKKYITARWVASLPILSGVIFVTCFVLISVLCDGSFDC